MVFVDNLTLGILVMNPLEAAYTVNRVEERSVFIVDQCEMYQCRSVTNDAENVVKRLYEEYGNRQFFYKDTEGQWDELVHHNGVFERFKSGVNIN